MEINFNWDNNHLGESMKDFPKCEIKKEPDVDEYISESDSIITEINGTGLIISKIEIEEQRVKTEIKDYECDTKLDREQINDESEVHPEFIKNEELILKEEIKVCVCSEKDDNFCSKCILVIANHHIPMQEPDRAAQTVPKGTLELQSSSHGLGIHAQKHLESGIQLGPYEGKVARVETTDGYIWKLDGKRLADTSDETNSNYFRYVNCARDPSEQNIIGFQYKGDLYYRMCRNIMKGEELLVFYGDSCNKMLMESNIYYKPIAADIEKDFFSCKFCYVGLKFKENRDRHQKVCRFQRESLKCKSEKKTETSLKKYDLHPQKRQCHLDDGVPTHKRIEKERGTLHKCHKCDFKSNYKSVLTRHLLKHSNKKRLSCKACQKGFNRKDSLDSHILSKHPDDRELSKSITNKIISCDICHFRCIVATHLNQHLLTHCKSKLLTCTVCQKGFNQNITLDSHILTTHPDDEDLVKSIKSKILLCNFCPFRCIKADTMKQHMQKYKSGKDKLHKCNECEYQTNDKSTLNKHLATHYKNKSWTCETCGTSFSQKVSLDSHILKKHSDDKNLCEMITNKILSCDFCDFRCISLPVFRHHLTKHRIGNKL